jgi:hypothetical protein
MADRYAGPRLRPERVHRFVDSTREVDLPVARLTLRMTQSAVDLIGKDGGKLVWLD